MCIRDSHVMSYFPEDGSFAERLGRLAAEALPGKPEHFLYIHEGINGASVSYTHLDVYKRQD